MSDPLHYLPVERWHELQTAFESNWLLGVAGYTILETQKQWLQNGTDYGFKVFCPFGDVWNGMVAINEKDVFYEIMIQSPKEDTANLEEALRKTKVIDWKRQIILPYTPDHIIKCVKRVLDDVNVEIQTNVPSDRFIIRKNNPLFKDINLPPGITFGLLSLEQVDLIDSKWPYRYPNSTWYFNLLINNKCGYGLFKNNELASWVFITEAGMLGHMYTLEEHRRKGYGELLLRLVCNLLLKDNKDAFGYCVEGNANAYKLYTKMGFECFGKVAWYYLISKTD